MSAIELLTDTEHSNDVKNGAGDRFLFAKDSNVVLCDNPGLESVFGCDAVRIGFKKRSFNDAERDWQMRYNDGRPDPWDNKLWAVYQVNWTQFEGNLISGTYLRKGKSISPGGLSDASICVFAVDTAANRVVSYMQTSYWVEDRHDIPNWEKSLFQKYPDQKLVLLDL